MAFSLSSIETQLSLLAWRDTQLFSITSQFENAWPILEKAIDAHVAEMPLWKIARAHVGITPLAHDLIAPWAEEQGRVAAVRAEEGLAEIIAALPPGSLAEHGMTALPALAGAGLIAASVMAVPAVVSYATVTSVSMLVFTTSTVSAPLLWVGGAAVAALSLTGSSALGYANRRTRNHLAERLKRHARTTVFGDGREPTARCLLNDTQALVLKAGQSQLETV